MTKACYKSHLETPWGPIKLTQQGKDNFTVSYGRDVQKKLSYAQAAAELGQAIMHWCACEGTLDNRMKGEK